MAQIVNIIRNLSKKHRDRIEKSRLMAEKMIKTAEAAAKETQKK